MTLPTRPSPSVLAIATLLAACATAQRPDRTTAEADVTAEVLAAHVRFLAGDLCEGRGVGTRGDELARAYLATQLESFGVQPGADNGSWLQQVPILGITSAVTTPLAAHGAGGDSSFTAPTDYTAVAGSPAADAAWRGAELVFAGYGITAPEQHWDDFGDVDLRGKVLLVMNNDPSADPERFAGKTRLYYGRWSYKFEEAARRGAAGAIVIHTNESAGYPFEVIQNGHGHENFWLPFREGTPTLGIRSWCSEEAAKQLCSLGGHDLDALRKRAELGNQPPVPLGVTLDLAIANTVREIRSGNVVGVLPGSDAKLKGEFVVVTAHFDHLGIGREVKGDAIYNGAVDNASGCAALLALARACCRMPVAARRSLLFVAVTGEESGLLGSQYFAENPTVPRHQMIANFNVDGLNVWGETTDLEFIGFGKNSLTALAQAVAAERGRTIAPDSNPDLGLFYRSDHFNFARIGVPAAYFKAGKDFLDRPEDRRRMKASYTATSYHKPSDEIAPWWRLDGAAADVRLLLACLLRCADADAAPTWTPGDEFAKLR